MVAFLLVIFQGMAYGILAAMPAINGLYTSLFAPIFYFFFGESFRTMRIPMCPADVYSMCTVFLLRILKARSGHPVAVGPEITRPIRPTMRPHDTEMIV